MNPLTWNTDRIGNRSRIYIGQRNWKDQSRWKVLDDGFIENSGGGYIADQLPGTYTVPRLATGSVELVISNRWNILGGSAINEPDWGLTITPENVRPVAAQRDDNQPSAVVYPNAFGDGMDLRYTVWLGSTSQVTREAVIRSAPAGTDDVTVSWTVRSSNARVWIPQNGQLRRPWTGNVTDAILGHSDEIVIRAGTSSDNESLVRGSGVKPPKAWYYTPAGEIITTSITLNITIVSADTVRVQKVIPRSFITQAFAAGATEVKADDTNTFFPDEGNGTTCCDGEVIGPYNDTWSAVRDAATGSSADNSSGIMNLYTKASGTTDEWNQIRRPHYGVDTNSLDDEENISSAKLVLSLLLCETTYNTDLVIVSSSPASNTSLAVGDYDGFGTSSLSTIPYATWSASPATLDFALNESGIAHINKTGVTNFGLRTAADAGDSPSWASGISARAAIRSVDTAGTGSDPYLEVTTGVAPSTSIDNSRVDCQLFHIYGY